MKKILVVDQGTTSTRAIIFDEFGKPLFKHQIEFNQIFPKPGWVEHDPEEIWLSVKKCCAEVLSQVNPQDLIGMGITNQRETTIVWERDTGKCIANAIVWQDRRTAGFCNKLKDQGLSQTIYQKTGLLIDPYFSATKLHWLLKTIPNAMMRAKKGELLFGTVDSFLLWRLTNGKVHATDITNAARTLLFNINDLSWDDDLLDIFSIPKQMLPQVKENCAEFGMTAFQLFKQDIPILAMMGDQQAALIGQGCLQYGAAKSTYGTGCFLMINTGTQRISSQHNLLSTIAYGIKGKVNFALEGSIFSAGSIVKWFRDQLQLIKSPDEAERLAKSLPNNGGVYFVPAFTGLGAPYWDAAARGAIFGLTRDTQVAHLVRAGLEAMAYQTKDLLNDENIPLQQLKVDGGVSANGWLMQFLANILQLPIEVSNIKEATALGIAYLVGLSSGYLSNLEEIVDFALLHSTMTYQPIMKKMEAEHLYKNWLIAVRRTRSDHEAASSSDL